jgi:hypothetical protein
MVTQIANIMDWQPFSWQTILDEWPYASLQLIMSRVAENVRKQNTKPGDPGFTSLDTSKSASPGQVMADLEERAMVANPNSMDEG